MQYSYEFKAQAVEKVLSRGPDVSFNSVAQSFGIDHSTLRRWVAKSQIHHLAEEYMTKEKTPQQWSPEQKLEAIIACGSMNEEQKSAWCRENGIFPHHLELWRKEFTQRSPKPASDDKTNIRQLKEENKALKKELGRKEKALAEAAALLVLKKKADQLWGTQEGD